MDFLIQGMCDANGNGSVRITHDISSLMWEVEQVSVVTGKVSSACTSFIKINGNLVAPSAALTPLDVGQGATAGGLPYVYLHASDHLDVFVQGAQAGDSITARAQYREFQLTDSEVQGR